MHFNLLIIAGSASNKGTLIKKRNNQDSAFTILGFSFQMENFTDKPTCLFHIL